MSYFIDFRPTSWSTRDIILERNERGAKTTMSIPRDATMAERVKIIFLNNFIKPRKKGIAHHSFSSKRNNFDARIGYNYDENNNRTTTSKAVIPDEITRQVANTIIDMVPGMKASCGMTGYLRYMMTNRPIGFKAGEKQFSEPVVRKLNQMIANPRNGDIDLQFFLDKLVKKQSLTKEQADEILSADVRERLRLVDMYSKQDRVYKKTNPLYTPESAQAFLDADEDGKREILLRWAQVTQSKSGFDAAIIWYFKNPEIVREFIDAAYKYHETKRDEIVDALSSKKFQDQAKADGITDEDKKILYGIIDALTDTHQDVRDIAPEEIDRMNAETDKKLKELNNGWDVNDFEDWSKDEDEDNEEVVSDTGEDFSEQGADFEIQDGAEEDEIEADEDGTFKTPEQLRMYKNYVGYDQGLWKSASPRCINIILSDLANNKSLFQDVPGFRGAGAPLHIAFTKADNDKVLEPISGEYFIANNIKGGDSAGQYRLFQLRNSRRHDEVLNKNNQWVKQLLPTKIKDHETMFDFSTNDVVEINGMNGYISIILKPYVKNSLPAKVDSDYEQPVATIKKRKDISNPWNEDSYRHDSYRTAPKPDFDDEEEYLLSRNPKDKAGSRSIVLQLAQVRRKYAEGTRRYRIISDKIAEISANMRNLPERA